MNGPDERREREPLLPKHGGYRNLKSFQVAQLAYDVAVRFCDRYIDWRGRMHDQMVQAARSGVQNIAEGSVASATSKKHGLNRPDEHHGLEEAGIPSMKSMPSKYAGPAANAALVLIGAAIALLVRQVQALAAAFEKEGGFKERLYRTRQQRRKES
ncbi:MAG: hypothetical protein AMXMBFR84_20970 [Candidatus Hydrogenedentota bacterium]